MTSPEPPMQPSRTTIPVLLVTGTLGAGKTAVATAIHDILTESGIPNACLDLDAFSLCWPPIDSHNQRLVLSSLGSIWPHFRDAGADRLILARVVEDRAELKRYEEAVPGAEVVICRLMASQDTRERRLRARESGDNLARHLVRTVELENILDAAQVEDFTVINEDRSMRTVAVEVLEHVGWLRGATDA